MFHTNQLPRQLATGRRSPRRRQRQVSSDWAPEPSVTVDELLDAARAAEVELAAVVADAEDRLARQAVEVCPGCSHKLHAFDVCRCGCDDQIGRRVEVQAAQR